jgi:mRNA interferase HigB
MKVLGLHHLSEFKRRHPDGAKRAAALVAEAQEALWRTPQDIKDRYRHASFLPGNVVVFNIHGNRYRLVARIAYQTQTVVIMRIGTHEEYDSWDLA